MMISGFVLNKEFIKVSKNGSISNKRDTARIIEGGEKRLEDEFISKIPTFREVNSKSAQYLCKAFSNVSLKLPDLKALTKIFAQIINTISPREAYRRKTTCYMWMDLHFDEISRALGHNELFAIVSGGLVRLSTEVAPQPVEIFQQQQQQCSNICEQQQCYNVCEQQKQGIFEQVEEFPSIGDSVPFSMNNQPTYNEIQATEQKQEDASYGYEYPEDGWLFNDGECFDYFDCL